jgi:hypothetical protein
MNNIAGLSESFATYPLPFLIGVCEEVNTPKQSRNNQRTLVFFNSCSKIILFFQAHGKKMVF